MVTRIVLLTMKRLDDIDRTVRVLRGMEGRIPGMRAVEVGAERNPVEHGVHIAVTTLHDDDAALLTYDKHPVQLRAQQHLKRVLERSAHIEYKV
jgi:Stress responsive A/B Barrel Domain